MLVSQASWWVSQCCCCWPGCWPPPVPGPCQVRPVTALPLSCRGRALLCAHTHTLATVRPEVTQCTHPVLAESLTMTASPGLEPLPAISQLQVMLFWDSSLKSPSDGTQPERSPTSPEQEPLGQRPLHSGQVPGQPLLMLQACCVPTGQPGPTQRLCHPEGPCSTSVCHSAPAGQRQACPCSRHTPGFSSAGLPVTAQEGSRGALPRTPPRACETRQGPTGALSGEDGCASALELECVSLQTLEASAAESSPR